MKQVTQIPIEHRVVTSDRSYEQVVEALEAQLGRRADWEHLTQTLISINATFEQAVQLVEQQLGTSGFTIFSKVEAGALLTLSGKGSRPSLFFDPSPFSREVKSMSGGAGARLAYLSFAIWEMTGTLDF